MRRLTPVLVVTILLSGGGAAATADLTCAELVVEKGQVRSGSPLAHRFTLINRGMSDVAITAVKPSCGCLAPRLEKRRLGPGEQGVLELTINTLTAPAGPQSWRVQVFYTSEGRPEELALLVRTHIVPEITLEPAALVLFTNGPLQRSITLLERRPQALTITDVRTTSPHLHARVGAPICNEAGHWSRVILLEVLPEFPEGRHEESLMLATADQAFGEWQVPVTVVKRARHTVSITPEAVTVTGTAGQALPARLVRLRGPDEEAVVVERVETDDPALRCEWAPGPGRQATLKVSVDATKAPHGLRSEVRCYLRQPSVQMVTIPVTWISK